MQNITLLIPVNHYDALLFINEGDRVRHQGKLRSKQRISRKRKKSLKKIPLEDEQIIKVLFVKAVSLFAEGISKWCKKRKDVLAPILKKSK